MSQTESSAAANTTCRRTTTFQSTPSLDLLRLRGDASLRRHRLQRPPLAFVFSQEQQHPGSNITFNTMTLPLSPTMYRASLHLASRPVDTEAATWVEEDELDDDFDVDYDTERRRYIGKVLDEALRIVDDTAGQLNKKRKSSMTD